MFFVEPFTYYGSDQARYYLLSKGDAAAMNTYSEAQEEKTLSQRQELTASQSSQVAVDEYLQDTMQHIRSTQNKTLPNVSLIDLQPDFQWSMRMELIDFIVEAHGAMALLPETLFLAVNLLDRYSTKCILNKHYCALVGCAALLIAAKYGDLRDNLPQINKLKMICCGLYTTGMFVQMEMHMLNILEWNICHPTVEAFWSLMVTERHLDEHTKHMARYICEIALYHRDFVSTKPMTMARVSFYLARAVLGGSMEKDHELNPSEIRILLLVSRHLHHPTPTLFRKHSTKHFFNVSKRLADFMTLKYTAHGCGDQASSFCSDHLSLYLHQKVSLSAGKR